MGKTMNMEIRVLCIVLGVQASPYYFSSSSVFKKSPIEFKTNMKKAIFPPILKMNIHQEVKFLINLFFLLVNGI